jgi:hypothetical protein
MSVYCGNNALDPGLISGEKILGSNYRCLKKGVGVGLNLPYDDLYIQPYQPIDNTKIYCGTKQNIPQGYDRRGNLPECFRKGVGVGRKIKTTKEKPFNIRMTTKKIKNKKVKSKRHVSKRKSRNKK